MKVIKNGTFEKSSRVRYIRDIDTDPSLDPIIYLLNSPIAFGAYMCGGEYLYDGQVFTPNKDRHGRAMASEKAGYVIYGRA